MFYKIVDDKDGLADLCQDGMAWGGRGSKNDISCITPFMASMDLRVSHAFSLGRYPGFSSKMVKNAHDCPRINW